jgi:phosphoribosylformylglycinamidine synthase
MSQVSRYFTEKKQGFDAAAKSLQSHLREVLELADVTVRIFNRYDIQGIPAKSRLDVLKTVLCEPMCDFRYEEKLPDLPDSTRLIMIEPVAGQFDAIADCAEQGIQLLLGGERPTVKTAVVYAVDRVSDGEFSQVESYLVNPLEYRRAKADKPDSLLPSDTPQPEDIREVSDLYGLGLAMSHNDIEVVKEYFKSEGRNPTLTEIMVLDTYWSDHCRHTTFNTIIKSAQIDDVRVQKAFDLFKSINGEGDVTLMNIATGAMRYLKKRGELPMLDESEEINACTVKIGDRYLLFKNETHNHPTEIEPFGGASTCIGGGIRDPLSGRAYVYQGMRITGAGDPRQCVRDTLPGKLPQIKLCLSAAEGFSSYSNQIGLASGYCREIYHPGYIAKRMEAGALVAAADVSAVKRERPAAGDLVLLLGGRTGRDGVGGATGSSVAHDANTVNEAACEVQKGNPPEERKIVRLFRNPRVTVLIKKCNDFGAGGVSVAVGELADGLEIDLDKVMLKYEGLNGTEIAISESQERMAIVIAEPDLPEMMKLCKSESVEAAVIAKVTESPRLVMYWRGKKIVNLARSFLDSNGAKRFSDVAVGKPENRPVNNDYLAINYCSQKGLIERFDSCVGAQCVFMPFGGKYALSQTQVMAAVIPGGVPGASRTEASIMSYGFDPFLTESDPFIGSAHAIVVSIAKLVATGADLDTVHLSLQEYFPRCDSPSKWGLPFAAMLGAFSAQMGLKIAAIGGKDSMSGSFGDLDVPPTLISFAVGAGDAVALISPEFKSAGNPVYVLQTPVNKDGLPDYEALTDMWKKYLCLVKSGKVLAAHVYENTMTAPCIINMALGNKIGFIYNNNQLQSNDLKWGSIVFEASEPLDGYKLLGETHSKPEIVYGNFITQLDKIQEEWEAPLSSVFATQQPAQDNSHYTITDSKRHAPYRETRLTSPVAVIPVVPGTNGEFDTAFALERAGAIARVVPVCNLTPAMLAESLIELEKAVSSAQMIVFPAGVDSAGAIVSLFKNTALMDAVQELLDTRDGLVLGIGDGFKALLRLGLLTPKSTRPAMAFNSIGRFVSRYVGVQVSSVMSPWLSLCNPGEVYIQPVAHSQLRFTASQETLQSLKSNSQIAFQYTDYEDSMWRVEGISSLNGRVLGKMAHFERYSEFTARNIPAEKFLPLFESGVKYFK